MVESLAEEFDVLDIAAAAVHMAQESTARESDQEEFEAPAVRTGPKGAREQFDRQPGARLFIGAGRRAGIRPADLVGAIAAESGVKGSVLGPIEITDTYSLIGVPEELANEIISAMKAATLRGKKVTIRRDLKE